MPPIKISSIRAGLLLAVCTAFAAPAAFADIVKMRSGEKLEGTITYESPTEVVIEVKIGNIKDVQTKQKKDVQEIIKATPDEKEVVELRKLLPTKDMMSDVEYQRVITDQLDAFLKKYSVSRYRAEVEGIRKTYQEELAQAKAGAKKLEGEWISPEEIAWNSYNFEAKLKRQEMQADIKEGKLYDAYQKYIELEKDKPASVEYVKALETIKTTLPELDRQLERMKELQPAKLKMRTENLKTLNADQRRMAEEAIKLKAADYKTSVDEARKNKVPIVPFYEDDLKSIQDAQTQIIREQARLNKMDVEKLKVSTAQFQQGLKLMHEKRYGAALKELEMSGRTFKDPFVKDRLEVAKKAAAEEKVATAMSGGATIPSTMQSATAAKPDAASAKPKPPGKTAAGAPVKPPATPATVTAPAAEDDNNGMVKILLGAAGVLLIAGIIAKIAGKKKAAASAE